jgi:site-specific recombinase XerD
MTHQITTQPQNHKLVLVEKTPLDRNPAAVYLASLSKSGRRTQQAALDKIAGMLTGGAADAFNCNWAAVRYQHAAAIRTMLAESYSPATANKMLSALRRVTKEAWKLGYVSAEIYQRVTSVENVKGETLPSGRELSTGELSSLMNACQTDPGPAGVRDAAMIALLYSWGLRRAEIIAINLSDYDPDTRELVIRGKRNKHRKAHLVAGAADALVDWLVIRGLDSGPLFWPINKGGNLINSRLTTQAVYKMLRKRAKQAGVKDFSPHDLRRTFVSDLLDAGADIAIVSKMAGHASVQTTARYDRRPEKAKRKTAKLLHVPYQRRDLKSSSVDGAKASGTQAGR